MRSRMAIGAAVLYFLANGFILNAQAQVGSGRYLVKMKSQMSAMSVGTLLESAGLDIDQYIPEIGVYVVSAPPAARLDYSILAQLANSGQVLYAEKDEERWHIVEEPRGAVTPKDPYFQDQYGLRQMAVDKAWATSTGSRDIVVAVTDTGVETNHVDLRDQIWQNAGEVPGNGVDDDANGYVDDVNGWDFAKNDNDPKDENGHGTHVAGIIGAEANNEGTVGVNWNVRIMPVRFLDARGSGSDSAGAQTIIYAAKNGARVINASWGSKSNSKAVQDALEYAFKKGALVVAAAGNDDTNTDVTRFYPQYYAPVSVAASGSGNSKASFSNYGPATVDLAAPGVGILATYTGGTWKKLSGTSMASPMVSGVAALILSVAPELSVTDLRNALYNAVYTQLAFKGSVSTDGELSALKALDQLKGGFQVWPARLRLAKGEKFQFTAYKSSGVTAWTSSNPAVATVSETGEVTALSNGSITLTAQDSTNTVSAQVEVVTIGTALPGGGGCGGARQHGPMTPYDVATSAANMGLPLFAGLLAAVFSRKRKNRG